MPKHVDHEDRREELATALWRLVMRDGIAAASIRRVAAEAGWSSGSLRHYFATHSDLLTFAMELVTQRATARIAALPALEDGRAKAELVLRELLPLDAERRAEMQVWLAFAMQAVVEPHLRPVLDRSHTGLGELCRQAAMALGRPDPELDGQRLHAFVDGLALHAVMAPGLTPERLSDLLRAELDALAG